MRDDLAIKAKTFHSTILHLEIYPKKNNYDTSNFFPLASHCVMSNNRELNWLSKWWKPSWDGILCDVYDKYSGKAGYQSTSPFFLL